MPSRGKTGIAAFLKMAQTEGVTEICSESPNPVTAWWPSLLQATREGSKIFSHVGSKSASTTDLTTADHGTSSSLMGPRIFSLPLNQSQSRTFPIFNIIFNIVCVCVPDCAWQWDYLLLHDKSVPGLEGTQCSPSCPRQEHSMSLPVPCLC